MRMMLRTTFAIAAMAATMLPFVATAADEDESPMIAGRALATPAQAAAGIPGAWWSGQRVGDDELAEQRGGADLHVNENNARAVVRDNVASNLSTGNNSINGDSFSGMSGVPMVVQNSGNNVVIQNSTILNLQLQ